MRDDLCPSCWHAIQRHDDQGCSVPIWAPAKNGGRMEKEPCLCKVTGGAA